MTHTRTHKRARGILVSKLLTVFYSVIAGEMTRAKATALIEELTLLCIIFPCEKIASDEPDKFPDLSTMFRFFVFKLYMFSVVVLILAQLFSCYTAKRIF